MAILFGHLGSTRKENLNKVSEDEPLTSGTANSLPTVFDFRRALPMLSEHALSPHNWCECTAPAVFTLSLSGNQVVAQLPL